jgi:hypothetical protein
LLFYIIFEAPINSFLRIHEATNWNDDDILFEGVIIMSGLVLIFCVQEMSFVLLSRQCNFLEEKVTWYVLITWCLSWKMLGGGGDASTLQKVTTTFDVTYYSLT